MWERRIANPTVRRSRPTIIITIAATCVFFAAGPTRAQVRSTGSGGEEVAVADRATLIILAPGGPVFADMQITVGRFPYRQWVSAYLARQLDTDRNNSLNSDELSAISDNIRRLADLPDSRQIIAAASGSPDAMDVSARVFAEWLRLRLPRAFDVFAEPSVADSAVRMTPLVDSDRDAHISMQELQQADQMLNLRDLDDDQTWSISELMPYRDPRTQNAGLTPDVASLPFLQITDDDSLADAATKILQRYGDNDGLPSDVLRLADTSGRAAEFSGGELLSRDQIIDLLRDPPFHLVIPVRLSDQANRSDVTVEITAAARAFCRDVSHEVGRAVALIDGMPVTVVARGGGGNDRMFSRGFLGQNFTMTDGDRNQYLDRTEFESYSQYLSQSGASGAFEVVDADHDDMIVRDEIFRFVDREQTAIRTRIEVSVFQDGKTLFGLLDRNADRRLSRRELLSGFEAISKYDGNGDGELADEELGTEYVLTIGLGRSEIRRSVGQIRMMETMQPGATDAVLPGISALEGPEWFRRMDRNQDGDVSSREFLGTAEQFLQLDSDADGLLSATEAEAVGVGR